MKIIKISEDSCLVEWKYKDFLRIGHEFQNKTILKLEIYDHMKLSYIKVTMSSHDYNL